VSQTTGSDHGLVLVVGGGPAGLTAGQALARRGVPVLVAEAGAELGGLARTVERDGYRFDLGGHRFFTKAAEVERIWRDALGDDLLRRPRLSRIYWNGRFLDYPLRAGDVVRKLGPVELPRVAASYAVAAMRRRGGEATFEEWVVRRFGRRLFELFFRSYTEKVWGVPTSELRAEWAAQRIRNLSFRTAVRAALLGNDGARVVSLIQSFWYPRLGPGQLWDALAAEIRERGGQVLTGAPVRRLEVRGGRVERALVGGQWLEPAAVISSAPLAALPGLLGDGAPPAVRQAAGGLRFRDFLTVALVLDDADPFPDTWIYVHDPGVRVGRIQNFRSWSPALVPPGGGTCLGLEYFCFAGDELWSRSDEDLVDLGAGELQRLRLADRRRVRAGHVIRVRGAYPIYDEDYGARVAAIRGWLDGVENLQQVGRNGLHRYNNVDHSMLTALRAVENVVDGAGHDIWAVNAESAYHEERVSEEQPYRRVPAPAGAA
jgi:protoporphyrinogen oxidase